MDEIISSSFSAYEATIRSFKKPKKLKVLNESLYDTEDFRINGKTDCPIGSNGLKYLTFILIISLITLLLVY